MPDALSRRRFLGVLAAGTTALGGCSALVPDADSPQESHSTGERGDGGNRTDVDDGSVYTEVYRETVGSVALVAAGASQGSGFVSAVPSADGTLVTNAHVVGDAGTVEVRFSRGDWRTARVVGTDVYSDLAVLSVDDRPGYAGPLPLVEESPVIGQRVAALGNPYGLRGTVSSGIVSGTNRLLSTPDGITVPGAVQTDAAVNPGNSGGPLVTLEGRVVGVINVGGGDNIGFAIPAALVRRVAPALHEDGEYRHPYLGVEVVDVTPAVAEANGLESARGVMVVGTVPGTPAAAALRASDGRRTVDGRDVPVGGDVVVAMDDAPIESVQDLSAYLAFETTPGETVTITVLRGGERRTVEATLAARPVQ